MTISGNTILIVDDDAEFVASLSRFLTAHDFKVLTACSGVEGVRLARALRPDLILIDVMLGEPAEGFCIIQEIRGIRELRDTPIFVLSSLYSQIPEVGVTLDNCWLALDDFLPKPVEMYQLLERIHARVGVPQ
jgi:DNA-binding response OmpR family regulator